MLMRISHKSIFNYFSIVKYTDRHKKWPTALTYERKKAKIWRYNVTMCLSINCSNRDKAMKRVHASMHTPTHTA